MAKTPKKPKTEEIETVPDAWERFEKAIDTVTHAAPKRKRANKSSKPASRSQQGRKK